MTFRRCFRIALPWLMLLEFTSWVMHAQTVPLAPGSVEGRIQNAITGDPIAGASVVMTCLNVKGGDATCGRTSATSRPDGTFRFDAVAPASYLVSGAEDGFVSMPSESLAMAAVEPGQSFSGLVVKLTPEAAIKGKVVDEAGNPMPGISVEALSIRRTSGRLRIGQRLRASTDKSGSYTLNRLTPGTYYVVAQAPKSDKSSASVRFFYPNALTTDQATATLVEPGQSYDGINIRLHPVATYRIQGKVADFAGLDEKLKSQLRLEVGGETQVLPLGENIPLGSDGSFDIGGVLPGSYVLRLKGIGSPVETDARVQAMSLHQLARQEIGIDGSDVTGVVLSISPPITVIGRVVAPESAASNLAQTQISLRPMEVAVSSYMTTKPQASGIFQFSPCDAVEYAVRVVAPSGLYVQSAEFNRQDALSHVMDLASGAGGELVVTLAAGTAALSGTLERAGNSGGQAQLPTYVFLIPANWNSETPGYLIPVPARHGAFAFADLAPGAYVLVALEWIGNSMELWRAPEFIQALRGEGAAIEFRPNDRLQKTIPVLSDGDVKRLIGRIGLN